MADITNNVTNASTLITDIIVWITTFVSNILMSIGMTEVIFIVFIGMAIYFFFRQHSIEPRKVYKF